MSKHIPTTEEVRKFYMPRYVSAKEAEFDRWLAQHEAEMVARTLNAVSLYLNESLIEAVSQGRVSLIFNELTDDEWLGWIDDAESLIKRDSK